MKKRIILIIALCCIILSGVISLKLLKVPQKRDNNMVEDDIPIFSLLDKDAIEKIQIISLKDKTVKEINDLNKENEIIDLLVEKTDSIDNFNIAGTGEDDIDPIYEIKLFDNDDKEISTLSIQKRLLKSKSKYFIFNDLSDYEKLVNLIKF